MAESTSNSGLNSAESASSLEHALLESLFYNEMMMMDGSASSSTSDMSVSSDFMAYLSANAENPQNTPDAGAIAEKAMLRDFGVAATSGDATDTNTNTDTAASNKLQPSDPVPDPDQWPSVSETSPHTLQTHEPKIVVTQPRQQPKRNSEIPQKEEKPEGQNHLLISQFATLAGRLGISLPSDVLTSLSRQAKDGNVTNAQESLQALSQLIQAQAQEAVQPDANANGKSSGPEVVPAVHPQQTVAEAAIATVTETRKRTEATVSTKAPLYSKRRKKPRLADCETKLAQLKAENEMLKRHLDTISNRSQKFDEERKAQEQQMKKLMNEGAGPEQLNPLLSKFSEVYSDYGRHRDQELTFHLEQLQRLVAPTNFTKMGLWTLGQNERFYTDLKRNPIAGILREELGITSQQGRKILEQSQKIRDLSENLKHCLRLLGKLKSICEHKQKVFSNRMSKCQEILTPLQVVKLLLWVDDHANILESTCPGWGSERIHCPAKRETTT